MQDILVELYEIVEKRKLAPPLRLINVLRCKNPRCITMTEQELDQVFRLADGEKMVYRCMYCETER